jgi:thiosulfate/3-mercaptopyruvate sulfurtransferase
MNDFPQIPAPPGPLVGADWLDAYAADPRIRVLDTRGRVPAPGTRPQSMRDTYEDGHIPGAQFVSWFEDFVDPDDPVPNQLASPARFAAAASALGIDADTLVVAYDDYHSIFAARLWWAFRAMGHEHVRVLDGGWTGWWTGDHEVATGSEPAPEPRTFHAHPVPELRWTIEQVAARPDEVLLVDARSRERFAGTGNDPVSGHIPGAVNVPYAELVGIDGLLRPARELHAVFAAAGIDPLHPPEQLVASCGSGISASVPLLALESLARGAGARGAVYDGSWAEWSRSGRVIATGSEPG